MENSICNIKFITHIRQFPNKYMVNIDIPAIIIWLIAINTCLMLGIQ